MLFQGSPLWIFLEIFQYFSKSGNFGIFSILRPLNDILLVSYDFLESIKVLKWKVKIFFSKGPPFGYFQKIQKVL